MSAVQTTASGINLSNLSGKSKLNTTYDLLLQDRLQSVSNSKDSTQIKKKVVLLLIDVLKIRKHVVKNEHAKKAGIKLIQPDISKKKMHADLKPESIQQ